MGQNQLSLDVNTTCDSWRERCFMRPPTTPQTPVPKNPLPWIWICHKCQHPYSFRATPRCLSCSHRFCGKCVSELDYTGWMVYDSYWSRRADPITSAKRRCIWLIEEAKKRSSACEMNLVDDSGEGHEGCQYSAETTSTAEEQAKFREEDGRIWLEWHTAELSQEHLQSHHHEHELVAEKSALVEVSTPAVPRQSRKRSLEISTDGIFEDIALYSAGQAWNWDPVVLPCQYPLSPNNSVGTGSVTWEEGLGETVSEQDVQGDHKWDDGGADIPSGAAAVWDGSGVLEDIIDPRLLTKAVLECGGA